MPTKRNLKIVFVFGAVSLCEPRDTKPGPWPGPGLSPDERGAPMESRGTQQHNGTGVPAAAAAGALGGSGRPIMTSKSSALMQGTAPDDQPRCESANLADAEREGERGAFLGEGTGDQDRPAERPRNEGSSSDETGDEASSESEGGCVVGKGQRSAGRRSAGMAEAKSRGRGVAHASAGGGGGDGSCATAHNNPRRGRTGSGDGADGCEADGDSTDEEDTPLGRKVGC